MSFCLGMKLNEAVFHGSQRYPALSSRIPLIPVFGTPSFGVKTVKVPVL